MQDQSDQLVILADEINSTLQSNSIHPDDLRQTIAKIVPALIRRADPAQLAQILSHVPLTETDASGVIRPNRRLALEVGLALGHERGQDLYRFAVLATKLT